ncbi:potassium channel family protein [Roseimaritima ulvae]|uniref:Voltage-gated potassium channel Kch n=1 Tax=Roseimaritima ulvae TaxID=980254 RepID=A0A5B9QPQ8_9BACT|nr:potassium channel protein [Roseimaritima ulvae]QEG39660.1 Voltage-gated potassium channel Kch [Roseimaritima ulvae]
MRSARSHDSPLQRITRGAAVLGAIFAISVLGYRFIGGYPWTESIWMVVITISTVGFSERSTLPIGVQLWTIGVILFGISASVYAVGGLIQWMLEGELERLLGNRRMTQELNQLNRHVIICGFGRMGNALAEDLQHAGRAVVVIDDDPEACEATQSAGYASVLGDATDEDVLREARIDRASALVTVLPSDAENVFITLTARNLNDQLQIVARAEQLSTESKLRQAGANRVVLPTMLGARQISRMVTRPATAELFDLVSEAKLEDVELDEIAIQSDSPLIGQTIGETELHSQHKLLAVAIKSSSGEMVFNPNVTHRLDAQDIVLVLGHRHDIDKYRKRLERHT